MGFQDTLRRYGRGAARRTRDRLALQGYAALVHGPLQELTAELAALRADLDHAERARLDLHDQLSVSATRIETLLEEVRALREAVDRIDRSGT